MGKILSISFLFTFPAFALVEYSDEKDYRQSQTFKKVQKKRNPRPAFSPRSYKKTSAKKVSKGKKIINAAIGCESHKMTSLNDPDRIGLCLLEARVKADPGIYIDASYWHTSKGRNTEESTISKKGNPTIKIGLNWLELGSPVDRAIVNVYGGMMFSARNSLLASTRTDKIIGLETFKRFNQFLAGMAFELRLTGNPQDHEMNIGDMHTFKGALRWMASPDILFTMEAAATTIRPGETTAVLRNDQKIFFSWLSPKLDLTLSPFVRFNMGARFQVKRTHLVPTLRIWNMKAAYGNSIFAGLSFSL